MQGARWHCRLIHWKSASPPGSLRKHLSPNEFSALDVCGGPVSHSLSWFKTTHTSNSLIQVTWRLFVLRKIPAPGQQVGLQISDAGTCWQLCSRLLLPPALVLSLPPPDPTASWAAQRAECQGTVARGPLPWEPAPKLLLEVELASLIPLYSEILTFVPLTCPISSHGAEISEQCWSRPRSPPPMTLASGTGW